MTLNLPLDALSYQESIQALFFDIDGTLVDSSGNIDSELSQELQELSSNGTAISLASGRPYFAARDIIREIGVNAPCMFFAGALVVDPIREQILLQTGLDSKRALEIASCCEENNFYFEFYAQDNYFTSKEHAFATLHAEYAGKEPVYCAPEDVVAKQDIIKMNLLCEVKDEPHVLSLISAKFPELKLGPARGAQHPDIAFINVNSPDTSREHAFEIMIEALGVDAKNVAAFGDSAADAPFIEAAGLGMALGGEDSLLKKSADYYLPSAEELGVLKALRALKPLLGKA